MADNGTLMVPELNNHKYHAFLTYATEDKKFATDVHDKLTTAGFSIFLADDDFMPGNSIINEICNAVKICRRVIMLLTPKFMESNFCQYEQTVAEECTVREGRLICIPILRGMSKDQIPERIKWQNYLDYDSEKDHFWNRLYKTLSDPDIHIKTVMPVGNVATGLAWSFFYGYLNFLLINHTERVERSEWWRLQSDLRRMSRKLFIIIPRSCYCHNSFHDADPSIEPAGKLETLKYSRAAVCERPYITSVYKVTNKAGEVFHFAGEYATPVLSMFEMELGRIAGLTTDSKESQVQVFYHTLQNILNHADSQHCHNKFYLHMYNDLTEDRTPLGEEICNLLKQEITKEVSKELAHQMARTSIADGPSIATGDSGDS